MQRAALPNGSFRPTAEKKSGAFRSVGMVGILGLKLFNFSLLFPPLKPANQRGYCYNDSGHGEKGKKTNPIVFN
jgi:hypothetical protein